MQMTNLPHGESEKLLTLLISETATVLARPDRHGVVVRP